MSDENALEQGAGEALPAGSDNGTPPRNDTEAAKADEAAAAAKKVEEEKAAADEERKKNRTGDYIRRLQRDLADARREAAEARAKAEVPAQKDAALEKEPQLQDFDFDAAAYHKAMAKWIFQQEAKTREEEGKKADTTRRQQELQAAYNERLVSFVDDHPDFPEVVNTIRYPLSADVEAAIMAHDLGPQIAYHLGQNDDDAFALASIQPHLAAAAVERIASRLSAAQKEPEQQITNPTPSKPVSKAPAPPPTVGGRNPTETPPEKLTDDDWYKRDRDRRRKR